MTSKSFNPFVRSNSRNAAVVSSTERELNFVTTSASCSLDGTIHSALRLDGCGDFRLRFLLYTGSKTNLGHNGPDRHDACHGVEDRADRIGKVQLHEVRDGTQTAAALKLRDLRRLGGGGLRREALSEERRDGMRSELVDEHRAENGEAKTGGEVPHGLGDTGRFAVGES